MRSVALFVLLVGSATALAQEPYSLRAKESQALLRARATRDQQSAYYDAQVKQAEDVLESARKAHSDGGSAVSKQISEISTAKYALKYNDPGAASMRAQYDAQIRNINANYSAQAQVYNNNYSSMARATSDARSAKYKGMEAWNKSVAYEEEKCRWKSISSGRPVAANFPSHATMYREIDGFYEYYPRYDKDTTAALKNKYRADYTAEEKAIRADWGKDAAEFKEAAKTQFLEKIRKDFEKQASAQQARLEKLTGDERRTRLQNFGVWRQAALSELSNIEREIDQEVKRQEKIDDAVAVFLSMNEEGYSIEEAKAAMKQEKALRDARAVALGKALTARLDSDSDGSFKFYYNQMLRAAQ